MSRLPIKTLLALMVLLVSSASSATCRTNVNPVEIPISGSISINAIGVGDGSALTSWLASGPTPAVFLCQSNGYYVSSHATGVTSTLAQTYAESGITYTVYPTGIAGIGFVVAAGDPNSPWFGIRASVRQQLIRGPFGQMGITRRAKFIKTGSVSGGSFHMTRKQVAVLNAVSSWGGADARSELWLGATTLVVAAPTCDLSTTDANRTITLDTIRLSDFTSATAGKKTFDLTANCSNNPSTVTFKFTGTPDPANTQLFKNTGTAANVGLYLYSRSGSTESIIGANGSNNTRTVSVSGNRAVLPLGAAYYRNGTPGKGTLASTATVNISYN